MLYSEVSSSNFIKHFKNSQSLIKKHSIIALFYLSLFITSNVFADSIPCNIIKKQLSRDIRLEYVRGDNQYQTVSENLSIPLTVKVVDKNNVPQNRVPVHFLSASSPNDDKDFKIANKIVFTDSKGIASTNIVLGTNPGRYEFIAYINNTLSADYFYIFKSSARNSKWVLILLMALIGGLALYLYGMFMMSEGMKNIAGNNLRLILKSLTNNRFVAVFAGTLVTIIIESSTATSILVVSLVQAQLMNLTQSIGILLGAGIGTTIATQLIAFKLTDYALIFIGIGGTIKILSKSSRYKIIGEAILGFGLLFFGLYIMSEAMSPLKNYEPFINLLLLLQNPLAGILVGFTFTALIHSSTAFIGIIIILSSQGLLTLEAGIPLLLGSNIGTTTTAILASINSDREAKRVALVFILIKIIGVLLVICWIPEFGEFIKWLSPKVTGATNNLDLISKTVPRQIANAHTVFNVLVAIVLLPFTGLLAKLMVKIFPDKPKNEDEHGLYKIKFLDNNLLSTPAIAISLAKAETLRMGDIVMDMLAQIIKPFVHKDSKSIKDIEDSEDKVDFLRLRISNYLTKISQQNGNDELTNELFQIMYTITELEEIADSISNNLDVKAKEWIQTNIEFSEEGKRELISYHSNCLKQLNMAIDVFKDVNLVDAQNVKNKHREFRKMAIELKRNHFNRLSQNVSESLNSSKIHMELMGTFRMINSHSTNIARIVLDSKDKREDRNIEGSGLL